MKLKICRSCYNAYEENFIAGAHFTCIMCNNKFYSMNACERVCVPCSKIAVEQGKCPCCGDPLKSKGR